MKTMKIIISLLFLVTVAQGNAQFFKRLSKKAKEAAEKTIERKVAEKTERETDKTFDTVFNNKGKLFKNKKTVKLDSYTFSHQYIMEVISGKDTTDITYYLTNEDEYMGSSFTMGKNEKFITVMDLPNSAIHSFMNLGDKKSMTSIKIDLEDVTGAEIDARDFSISATGQTKNIIGFECQEYQVTGPQISGTAWVTHEAGISFEKAFKQLKSKKIKAIKGMDNSWLGRIDGLALETRMIDYSSKNPKLIETICTSISEIDFSINTSEYEKPF